MNPSDPSPKRLREAPKGYILLTTPYGAREEPLSDPPPPKFARGHSARSYSIDDKRPLLQPAVREGPREDASRRASSLYRTKSEGAGSRSNRYSQYKALRKHAAALPMETSRATANSISSGSTYSSASREDIPQPLGTSSPFVLRYGRRYLKNVPYPLPVDLPELHRQNLYTLLATKVFGQSLCSPLVENNPPRAVLEIGCGSGYWSAQCHDFLAELGCLNVAFTGVDVVQLSPDFAAQGINWRFVQHDIRKLPLPFDDGSFDLVVLKDLSLVLQVGQPSQRLLDEAIRLLRPGGLLEIWEADHVVRSLLPHPPPPPGKGAEEDRQALLSGTFLISSATPFGPAKNKYIQDYNAWIQQALDRRKLSPVPCTRMLPMLLQEPDALCEVGGRRIAIPFGDMRWENEGSTLTARRELAEASIGSAHSGEDSSLADERASLRASALYVLTQFIESMEPLLKEVSGKNDEEWQRWWGWMMADLFQNDGAGTGDCLELGVYWAKKR